MNRGGVVGKVGGLEGWKGWRVGGLERFDSS